MWLILDGTVKLCHITWHISFGDSASSSNPSAFVIVHFFPFLITFDDLKPLSTTYSQPPLFLPSPTRLYPSLDPLFLSSLDNTTSFTPPCCDLNLQSSPQPATALTCHRRHRYSYPFVSSTSLLLCLIMVALPPFHSLGDHSTIFSAAPPISLVLEPNQHRCCEERSSVFPSTNSNPIPLNCNIHPPIKHLPSF